MKKSSLLLFSLIALLFVSCTMSTSDIERETKKLMIEKFKSDGQNLVITDLKLIHETGNSYKGLADCTLDGEEIQLDVSVLCDGENIQAEWAPTAEYQQKALNQALEETEQEINKAYEQAEQEINRSQKEFEETMNNIQEDLNEPNY